MTKLIVSLLVISLFCAATATPSKQYAKCAFPGTVHQDHGVILFKQAGDTLVGRSNIRLHGGDKTVEVELTKRPRRDTCERLMKWVDVIDMLIFKLKLPFT